MRQTNDAGFVPLSAMVLALVALLGVRDMTWMGLRPLEIVMVPVIFVLAISLVIWRRVPLAFAFMRLAAGPIIAWVVLTGVFAYYAGTIYSEQAFRLNFFRLLVCLGVGYVFFIYTCLFGSRALRLTAFAALGIAVVLSISFVLELRSSGLRMYRGGFLDTNYFASYILVPTSFALSLATFAHKASAARIAGLGLFSGLVLQLILTTSRTGLVAALLLGLYLLWKAVGRRRIGNAVVIGAALAFGVAATIMALDYLASTATYAPLVLTIERKLSLSTSRYELWRVAAVASLEHPLFGVGLGQGPYEIGGGTPELVVNEDGGVEIRPGENVEHSLLLETLLAGGVPFAALMAWVLVRAWRGLARGPLDGHATGWVRYGWSAGFFGQLVMGMTLNVLTIRHLWMYVGIGLALDWVSRSEGRVPRRTVGKGSPVPGPCQTDPDSP